MLVKRITDFPISKYKESSGITNFHILDIEEPTVLIIDSTRIGSTVGFYKKCYNFSGKEVSEFDFAKYLGQALVIIPWKP